MHAFVEINGLGAQSEISLSGNFYSNPAQDALREAYDNDTIDEYETALALARRKARSLAGLERDVAYRRLAGMLARRGFGAGTVHRVLREVLDASVDESLD